MSGYATNQALASQNVPTSLLTQNNFRFARDTSAIIGSNLAKSGSPTQKTRLARLGKSDAAHQVRKTRVTAEGIKEGMHFDVLQNR